MKYRSYKNRAGGQTVMIVVVLFTIASMTIVLGAIAPVFWQIRGGSELQYSKKSYFAAEAGAEDMYYRIKNELAYSNSSSMIIDGSTVNITVQDLPPTDKLITSQGNHKSFIRTVLKGLTISSGYSFNFGIQTGPGGLYMKDDAEVWGNVYTNGKIIGSNNNPAQYNLIRGTAIAATSGGRIEKIHATSSAYAHEIVDSTIEGNAYYAETLSNSTVSGSTHPNSPDLPEIDFPISDELIDEWKDDAASGGNVTCTGNPMTYTIDSDASIGPKKIPCNLVISGNGTDVTITGNIWVVGDVTISGNGGDGVRIRIPDSLLGKNAAIIADDTLNRNSKGIVNVNGNNNFYHAPSYINTYVLLISQNSSAENNTGNVAMEVVAGAIGDLLVYASHGEVAMRNHVQLKEVVAYKLSVYNDTKVFYSIGLAQSLFTSGPGGTWKIKRWLEGL